MNTDISNPKEKYEMPEAEVVMLTPPRLICSSNEDILPGDEMDWAPFFGGDGFNPPFPF